jgi:hypothetical protein
MRPHKLLAPLAFPLAVAALWACLGGSAFAGVHATVGGRVTLDGVPVAGASVIAWETGAKIPPPFGGTKGGETITDSDGRYSIYASS